MWKNIFIESCLLSALIFGGFYIHSKVMTEEISVSDEALQNLSVRERMARISGSGSILPKPQKDDEHISGKRTDTPQPHVSGLVQPSPPN
ncbi:MAG: hypothetical protein IID18_00030 [Nitrospinae bacterium]|nr:hypothetical protein [Nitrospinota bacterium]